MTEPGTEVLAPSALEDHGEHIEAGSPDVPWVVLPFLRAPSTDLNMTAALALIAVVMTQVIGFRALGPSYLTKFFNFKTLLTSPLGAIDMAVGLLELIGEFAKILSFSFRLLGNIFAGSILLFVMSFLVPFLPWPFFILEFFVGVIQASCVWSADGDLHDAGDCGAWWRARGGTRCRSRGSTLTFELCIPI